MDVKDYCKNVDIELNAWRAKLYNVMSQLDGLPADDKPKINHQLNGIHTIVHDLDDRIHQLRTSCPTKWAPEKTEIKSKIKELEEEYDEVDSYFF